MRQLLLLWLVCAVLETGARCQPPTPPEEAAAVWHDLSKFPLEGKGWRDTKTLYDRLPARAEGIVRPPVWTLSQDSTGLRYRFVTAATFIRARWKLREMIGTRLPHMAATGSSGVDLYVRYQGAWRALGVGMPYGENAEHTLVRGLSKDSREYMLYLPLYNGVSSVELGLPRDASLEPAPERDTSKKAIVFYGTSILQGCCASRPGMAYPSILGRMLDWPTINLGFSGNGRAEPEVANFLAELDPVMFVLDPLPNLESGQVSGRLGSFVKILRGRHPSTPIVLVENVAYTDSFLVETRRARVAGSNRALREVYNALVAAGDKHVLYVPSWALFGSDGEDTVDGTHPTDIGAVRMARGMEPVLREAMALAGVSDPAEPGFEMGNAGAFWPHRRLRDFILRFDAAFDAPAPCGIVIRAGSVNAGIEVVLDGARGSGSLLPAAGGDYLFHDPEGARVLRREGWNKVEIRVFGDPARIRVSMNGRIVSDYLSKAGVVPTGGGVVLRKSGKKVRIRNVRMKALP
ncbi:MAG: SGNH/GDSL hydrolase family protein [Bryobacteraceae bacterium]